MANYKTGSGTSHTNGLTGVFMVGWFVGMVTCLIVTLWSMSGETTIQSNKIIIPEKKLTTDGKTIDTLYIYKQ
jgi:hypothetical protein